MKRLRHPITSLREPCGKAGLTVAICALVLAMVGGAYAAGGLTKAQEKQVTKIAKKFAGKPGAAGPAGAAGAAGPAGAKGSDGEAGEKGEQGIQGIQGEEGEPWTPNGTLPKGASEKGSFGAAGVPGPVVGGTLEGLYAPISYNIPLAAAPTPHVIQFEASVPAGCKGSVAQPEAEEGNLCIFVREFQGLNPEFVFPPETGAGPALENIGKAGKAGTILLAPGGAGSVYGTWAVTAK